MSESKRKNNSYTTEFKLKAVEMYLSGEHGGINTLTKELGLKSHSQIKRWIAKYKAEGVGGFKDMRGRTSSGRPKKEYSSLEEEVIRLRAENEYLRKLNELMNDNVKKRNVLNNTIVLFNA